MATRQVRLEGGSLLLDGKPLLVPDAPQSLAITAFNVTDDGNTVVTGDERGQIRVWDITAEPKLLWFGNVIPGAIKAIAISADRQLVFVQYDWAMWGPCFDAFTVQPHGEYKSVLRLHLRLFPEKARIEFGKGPVLWHDPAEKRWRLSEDGRYRW